MSGQSLCSIVGVKCEETVMAPYIDGSNGDYDEDYYDLSSLFVPVMLDKPKDISMLLPPFILEELAVIEPKVKSVSEDNNEGDSQVSESHDNDELSIVDEELHKLVEQKLNDFSTDILSKSYGDYHGDLHEVILPMIVPIAMIGGGEAIREITQGDWEVTGINMSSVLDMIPDKVINDEKVIIPDDDVTETIIMPITTTVSPMIVTEVISDTSNSVLTTMSSVIDTVVTDELNISSDSDVGIPSDVTALVNQNEHVVDDHPEVMNIQPEGGVIVDLSDEQTKILHDEEIVIPSGEKEDRVRVTLTQKWVNPPKLVVRVNNDTVPVISATIVIQDDESHSAKIGDQVTGGVKQQVGEYEEAPIVHERVPRFNLGEDTHTFAVGDDDVPVVLPDVGDEAGGAEVRARDADSIFGALVLIGVLLGNLIFTWSWKF